MRAKICLAGLIFTAAAVVWAAGNTQMPNVRLGLWDWTETTATSGQMALPDDLLARLTPEQRAKMEAAMMAAGNRTHSYKTCVTKEKLEKGSGFNEEKKGCSEGIVSSSGNKYTYKFQCTTEDGMKMDGSGDFETLGQEAVKGAGHITTSASGRTMNSDITINGKWVEADCGSVK